MAAAGRKGRGRFGRLARHVGRAVFVTLLAGIGCGEPGPIDPRPLVVVTVPPFQALVEQLGGEHVRTAVLLPPGANPASHAPTLAERRALADAELLVTVGHPAFPFEATWLAGSSEAQRAPTVEAARHARAGETADPHVWLVPSTMAALAREIATHLERLVPAAREEVAANLASFEAEADRLESELRAILAGSSGQSFLVFHPAWGHFARHYGLTQVAIERGHRHPDPHALAEQIAWAREVGVPVVFVQPQFDPAGALTLADEIGARVEPLDPLAYDWAANLRRAAAAIAAARPTPPGASSP